MLFHLGEIISYIGGRRVRLTNEELAADSPQIVFKKNASVLVPGCT